MTRFNITNLLFAAALIYLLVHAFVNGFEPLVFVFFAIAYLLILTAGVIFTQLNFFIDHELAGDARYNEISLTFDDGPHADWTPMVLEKLAHYKVKACFFVIGEKASQQQTLITKIHEQGHLIGNHSYYHHTRFPLAKLDEMILEINKTNKLIYKFINKYPVYFRPPFGVTNPRLAKAVSQTKMLPVAWSLRTYDTSRTVGKVIRKLQKKLNGGDIILLHDQHEGIIEIIDFLIPYAQEKGFKFVPLDELLNQQAYE